MEEHFLTDDGSEIVMLPRERSQTVQRLAGAHEIFDHDTFDFHILKPVPDLALRWNRTLRLSRNFFATLRFFFAVASLTILVNQAAAGVSQDRIESLGDTTFRALAYVAQFFPVPFLFIVTQQFNNFFAELVYYKYLSYGAIIDFPASADKTYLTSRWQPMMFVVCFTAYCIFVCVVLIIFEASISIFVVVSSSLMAILSHWYSQQTIEDKLISLSEYIQSFPDETGGYDNIDRCSLGNASVALKNLKLLEGRQPSYHRYWRNSYFKSVFAETKVRVGLSFITKFGVVFIVSLVIVYAMFLLTVKDQANWTDLVSPCVSACVVDDTQSYQVAARCNGCLCRCLKELGLRMCGCTQNLVVGNCSSSTEQLSAVCSCGDPAVQCL